MSDYTGTADLADLVGQVEAASLNIKRADKVFRERLDGLENNVNELFRKTSRPGVGGDTCTDERKSAIDMCKSRRALTINKVEEREYSPSSAEVDQAISAQHALKSYLRHGDLDRLGPEHRKSLSAFSFGPPGNFLLPPTQANRVLSCLVYPTNLSGLVDSIIDPAKLKLLYERCRTDVLATRAIWQSNRLCPLSASERILWLLDAEINVRGICHDRAFVAAARDLAIAERSKVNIALAELTDGTITTANQAQRFLAVINARGHSMTTLNRRAVAQVLANKPDDFVEKLLRLRQEAARASVRKFDAMLAYASPIDDRIRGTVQYHGSATGRWAGRGPQLQNLKRNQQSLPLSIVDAIRNGDREELARYGRPLELLGDVLRAALCAAPSHELKAADLSAIESRILAWFAGETWKLDAYRQFDVTGDTAIEPYRVLARRMLGKPADAEVSSAERRIGKYGELGFGFAGSILASRRILPDDPRTDDEIRAAVRQYRAANPAIVRFWHDLARAIRVAINLTQPITVGGGERPEIVAAFDGCDLTLTLPSGRTLTYPDARLVPGKFEDGPPDVEAMSNAKGQWCPRRLWFGVFVENVVQATARDILAAAMVRVAARGLNIVHHCHDEITAEVPTDTLSDDEYLAILDLRRINSVIHASGRQPIVAQARVAGEQQPSPNAAESEREKALIQLVRSDPVRQERGLVGSYANGPSLKLLLLTDDLVLVHRRNGPVSDRDIR